MALRSFLGDRRAGLRFEIAGHLWASIDVRSHAVLHNITPKGALIETRMHPELQTTRAVRLALPGGPDVDVQIRHVTPIADARELCLVGVEFVGLTSEDRRAIDIFIVGRR